MLVDRDREFDFLDDDDLLLLPGGALALVFFVQELAVILNAANGGTAFGETSTRSSPRSRAIFKASKGVRMPSCSPASSITRTSRARILSLMRINCLAERLSMGFLRNSWHCHVATQYIVVRYLLDANTVATLGRYRQELGEQTHDSRQPKIPNMVFCLVARVSSGECCLGTAPGVSVRWRFEGRVGLTSESILKQTRGPVNRPKV